LLALLVPSLLTLGGHLELRLRIQRLLHHLLQPIRGPLIGPPKAARGTSLPHAGRRVTGCNIQFRCRFLFLLALLVPSLLTLGGHLELRLRIQRLLHHLLFPAHHERCERRDAFRDEGVDLRLHNAYFLCFRVHVREAVTQPKVQVKDVESALQIHEIGDGFRLLEGPLHLLTQPVERAGLAVVVLPCHLEKHGTHERHLLVDGSGAEDIPGPERQRHVLQLICQVLEVVHVAHEVQVCVYCH